MVRVVRTMNTIASEPTAKPKRIRRWARRPANPNDDSPNATLSVRDVHLLIRELENYLGRIRGVTDRETAMHRRHAQKLIDKLHQVEWKP